MSKKQETEIAVVEPGKVPAIQSDPFAGMEGQGLENVTNSDVIIPRITIIQALSPQLKPKKQEYIKGAKVGDICDVGTLEIYEAPFIFLPVHYVKQWLEWAPRDTGKGLVKIHDTADIIDACSKDEKNRPITKDGNLIQETAQFFGLNISGGGRRCFLPMASTQLKKARRWLTLATSEKAQREDGSTFTPPLFYRTYNISVVEESSAENDWFGWKIERGVRLQEIDGWKNLFDDALAFRNSLKKGEVKGDLAHEDDQSAADDAAM